LQADGVQLHFVGERSGLSQKVAHGIEQAELATASNSRLILNICFNYGGPLGHYSGCVKVGGSRSVHH
jgi:undecaprenyl diphosphate synthase